MPKAPAAGGAVGSIAEVIPSSAPISTPVGAVLSAAVSAKPISAGGESGKAAAAATASGSGPKPGASGIPKLPICAASTIVALGIAARPASTARAA